MQAVVGLCCGFVLCHVHNSGFILWWTEGQRSGLEHYRVRKGGFTAEMLFIHLAVWYAFFCWFFFLSWPRLVLPFLLFYSQQFSKS